MNSETSDCVVKTSIGHAEIDDGSTARVAFILEAYGADSPLPLAGPPTWAPAPAEAARLRRAATTRIYNQALGEAVLMGAWDVNVAEEAAADVLLQLASAKVFARLDRRRSPRRYVDRMAGRAVRRIVGRNWARQMNAPPLPDGLAARGAGPLALAEVRDTAERCAALLGVADEAATRPPPVALPEGMRPGTAHVRRHRDRKRTWAKIAHLFPWREFRPPLRKRADPACKSS